MAVLKKTAIFIYSFIQILNPPRPLCKGGVTFIS